MLQVLSWRMGRAPTPSQHSLGKLAGTVAATHWALDRCQALLLYQTKKREGRMPSLGSETGPGGRLRLRQAEASADRRLGAQQPQTWLPNPRASGSTSGPSRTLHHSTVRTGLKRKGKQPGQGQGPCQHQPGGRLTPWAVARGAEVTKPGGTQAGPIAQAGPRNAPEGLGLGKSGYKAVLRPTARLCESA